MLTAIVWLAEKLGRGLPWGPMATEVDPEGVQPPPPRPPNRGTRPLQVQ